MTVNNILGQVHYLENDHVSRFIQQLLRTNKPISLGFLNQYGFNLIIDNHQLFNDFSALSYLLRDGIGIKIASLMTGFQPKANLNGTDLIPQIMTSALNLNKQTQFFVYGTQEPWLSKGTEKLLPNQKVTLLDGFKDNQEYLTHYQDNACPESLKVVLLAMGMPKQEKVARLIVENETTATLVICGGAIIDFQAGKTSRAPKFMRENGMEWLYRLFVEPKRMFNRYVIGIPVFFSHLFIAALRRNFPTNK
ncbi:conserved protein of unknown function [Vibrio tapetis subsp. tapetis]|uniref:Uncharacterized protein n=2 Tax=Vibrio tapetis TaxID=52443 RepID=A0A2N8ZLK3_9VIBR|nr:conserved protein of unknown function [Vibrio tapetis subsp. tapetis]